ncbi:MAG: long-chain fatty acid--CoA ligase [Planctomycetaceae bacterium]|jgi:long-chain acyl-CoA synthetase|nr:long-chain fatty acid--CoA ligase [Planctomycetaceae bacterium]
MSLNLASALQQSAALYPADTAIICGDRSYTFAELERWTGKIAEFFLFQGVRKGDHILLLAPNVPEFTAIYYAALRIGAVVVPINVQLLSQEIADILEHSDAKHVVVWHTLAEKGLEAFEKTDSCINIFFIGAKRCDLPENVLGHYTMGPLHRPVKFVLDELLDELPGNADYAQTSPDDTAVILYTSGTTGKSKGVELTHFNLFSNALYAQDRTLFIKHGDTAIAVLPLFHTFGQTAMQNAPLLAGAAIVMIPHFEVRKALGEMEKHKVTHIAAVPTMYNLMLQMLRRRQYDLAHLRAAISGGASLPAELYSEFEKIFHFPINEGYGLSETSPIVCMTHAVEPHAALLGQRCAVNKPGSIGPPIYGAEVKIMREDGAFADTEEAGELVVRGHNVMKGYYKDSAATEAAFVNGWFKTGDIAKCDADGYVYILDRAKDVIIRAGMNIYPREIEEVLHHHPAVQEAAVVGIADETLSESVIAFVVRAADSPVTVSELQKYCREHLALYKCPKTVVFQDTLPKNSTGKIQKRDLKKSWCSR